MLSLIKLIQNENMKLYKRTGTWVMIGILVLSVIGVGLLSKFVLPSDENANWKESLIVQNEQMQKLIDDNPLLGVGGKQAEQQIAINNYRIENDIPPLQSKSLWGFMIDTTNFTGLAALFTIVVAAGMVASEFSWGTIKLLLIRPVSRSKILLSKYSSTIIFALFTLVLLFGLSLIFGALLFGTSGLEHPYLIYQNGEVLQQRMLSYIISLFAFNSVDLLMMVTFSFMISTVFRSSSLAIGISIFLMFTGPQLVQFLSNYKWSKYILFANTNLLQYKNGVPLVEGMNMNFSIAVLSIYFISFIAITWFVFKKRDVTA